MSQILLLFNANLMIMCTFDDSQTKACTVPLYFMFAWKIVLLKI